MNVLSFVVPGEPVPKKRPRTVRLKSTGRRVTFTPKETVGYETRVKAHALREAALSGWTLGPRTEEYELSILIRTGRTRRFDLDNVQKAIADALQPEIIRNDSQITSWRIGRSLDSSGAPCAHIVLSRQVE